MNVRRAFGRAAVCGAAGLSVLASGLVAPARGPLPSPLRPEAAEAQTVNCPTNPVSPLPTTGTRRLSSLPNNQSNAWSYEPQMSGDGKTVAYTSYASNLVGGDTNNTADVFVSDSVSGAISRASVSSAGVQGERASYAPTVSGDGQKVAFYSEASNLLGGDGDPSVAWGAGNLVTPYRSVSASTFITLEAWFNTTTGGPIFGMANQIPPDTQYVNAWVPLVYVGTDGRLRGTFWQMPQITSSVAVNDGRWHHVVLTGAGSVQYLYLDGNFVGYSQGTIHHLNMDWTLVGAAYGSGWPAMAPGWTTFNGRIDEPAIYHKYLPPERVVAHHAARTGTPPSGYFNSVAADLPTYWWRLNEINPVPLQAGHPNAFAVDAYGRSAGIWMSYQALQYGRYGALTVDSNAYNDVYLRQGATTTLLSKGLGGQPANGHSHWPEFSSDGRFVAFLSTASNLVAGDTNGVIDTFVVEVATGAIQRVSVSDTGTQGNANSLVGRLSGDGRYVAFYTDSNNLVPGDTNGKTDVFLRDRQEGKTIHVSVGSGGVPANGDSVVADVSADGKAVVYYSLASNLVAGDTNGTMDVFLYDRSVDPPVTTKISTAPGGAPANGASYYPRISANGRHVVYNTTATNLVANDGNGTDVDTVTYDRATNTTTLVSAGPNGTSVPNADSLSFLPAISADGSRVALDYKGALVGTDSNNVRDVYFVDRELSVDAGLGALLPGLGVTAGSDQAGLEQFYPYRQTPLGTGNAYVNLANGNLVAQFEDQVVPAQGLNLVIRHTYNSQRAGGLLGLFGADSGMGPGWSLSISDVDTGLDIGGALGDVVGSVANLDVGAALHTLVATVGGVTGTVLDFVDTDGTAHRFVRTGGPCTRWESPPGVNLKVMEEYDTSGGLVAYRLVRPDGVAYRATPEGLEWRVTSVSDRNGNTLTYTWKPKGLANRLTEVTHNRLPGEKLAELVYNDLTGALEKIVTLPGYVAADPATGAPRSWERTTLFHVAGPAGLPGLPATLQTVTQPGNQTTSFSYAPLTGLLTEVKDGRQKPTTFAHDTAWPPRVDTITDRGLGVWDYGFAAPSAPWPRVTTVKNPHGDTTSYTVSGLAPVNEQDRRPAGNNITQIVDPGTDAGPVTTKYVWTANRLTTSIDGANNERKMDYNDPGLLLSVTEPSPNNARPGLPANAPTVPVNHKLNYDYPAAYGYANCPEASSNDEKVRSKCFAVAELKKTTFAADLAGQTRVTDFEHDPANGNLRFVKQRATPSGDHPDDRVTEFTYYPFGGLRTVDGPLPNDQVRDVTTFGDDSKPDSGYDRTGMPKLITDALDNFKEFKYTPYGLVGWLKDRDDRISTSTYSERDKLRFATDPGNDTIEYRYDENDQRTEERSAMQKVVRTTYDDMGRITVVKGPALNVDEPGTITTTTEWRSDGVKTREINALGGETKFDYWPNQATMWMDEPTTGEAKARTEYFYDGAGRLRQIKSPPTNTAGDRPVESVTYTPQSAIARRIKTAPMAGDATTDYAFDAHGGEVQAKGPRQENGVDAETTTSYSAFGEAVANHRRLSADKTLDTLTTFDKAGNQIAVSQPTGANGRLEARYQFDAIGQLIGQGVDPSNKNHTVTYTYSGEGQQLTRVDKGAGGAPLRTTTYTYNPDNTRQSMVATDHTTGKTLATCNYAAGATDRSLGYDADGNLRVTRTVLGAHGCDLLAGDVEIRTLGMEYDEDKNFMKTATQTIRLPAELKPSGSADAVTRTQAFTYNNAGAKRTATHGDGTPSNTRKTDYVYDPSGSGRLTTIGDWRGGQSTSTYFPSGAPMTQSAGNTATATYDHRRDGSPASLVWEPTSGTSVRSHTNITYDVGGLRTGEEVSVRHPSNAPAAKSTGGTASFTHDLVARLTSWKNPFSAASAPKVTYVLDDGGNITSQGDGAGAEEEVTSDYTGPDPADPWKWSGKLKSRTTAGTTVTFGYNDLGEETSRTTAGAPTRTVTTYDPAGHTAKTAEVDASSGAEVSATRYLYDTTDRLIARAESTATSVTSVTLYFYWGNGGALAEETNHAGATKALYLVDPDGEAIAQHTADPAGTPTTWAWLLNDAQGNVATLIDDAGAVVEQKAYDPYGKDDTKGSARLDAAKPKPTLGFQGHITDPKGGSVVLGARLYDPTTQRFTTADTFVASGLDIALATDPLTGNRYLYAAANPVGFYDDGHWPSPGKLLKKVAKVALPAIAMVPYVGTGIEVISLATGRDLLDGGRKMDGKERLIRTGLLAGGALVGVAGGKAVAKVLDKVGDAKKAKKLDEATEVAAKAETKVANQVDEAACAVNSFVPGTPVLMADGSTKAIEHVDIGDLVLATNPETGEQGARAVTRLITGDGVKDLVDVDVDGAVVTATAHHPFWVDDRGQWIDAERLLPGDDLLLADGTTVEVDALRLRSEVRRVHNLTVEGIHTYHVMAGDDPVLVHNCGKDIVPKSTWRLGQWGEARLAQVLHNKGVKPANPFWTKYGYRYVDRLVNGIAHEAKAGRYVKFNYRIERQILKDAELVASGAVRGVHWHFFQGVDPDVLLFLKQNKIDYTIHP